MSAPAQAGRGARRFVSIGECMIELAGADTGADTGAAAGALWRQGVAGDTLNTAWYARAAFRRRGADWRVDYATRLGTDPFSDGIVAFLDAAGVGTGHVQRDAVRGPGLYAITLDRGERSFTYWRGQSAARGLADDPGLLAAALKGADIAFASGITVAILPPEGRETLRAALAGAAAGGARVAFDPNIRPGLWADMAEARGWIGRFAAVAHTVLPSFDDEAQAFGDADPAATRARYRAAGATEVVVKNAGGPILWAGEGREGTRADLPRAAPVDTTGAGDGFNGAYLAARACGEGVEAALTAAHACAAAIVMRAGALVPVDEVLAAGA